MRRRKSRLRMEAYLKYTSADEGPKKAQRTRTQRIFSKWRASIASYEPKDITNTTMQYFYILKELMPETFNKDRI